MENLKQVLIVGCSFAEIFGSEKLKKQYLGFDFTICHSSGSGNHAIWAALLDLISTRDWYAVVVMLSGLNRLDYLIGDDLHQIWNSNPEIYSFYRQCNGHVWYHSGGIVGTGNYHPCPETVRNHFTMQYKSLSAVQLIDHSLSAVVAIQNYLSNQKYRHDIVFIYDPRRNYQHIIDEPFGCGLEHTLGQIPKHSRVQSLIDWNRINLDRSPFELAYTNGTLQVDGFHPTTEFMLKWWDQWVWPKILDQPR